MYRNRRIACADRRSASNCAILRFKLGHWLVAAVGGDEPHISGDHPMLGDAEREVAGRRESRVIVEGRIDGLVARET